MFSVAETEHGRLAMYWREYDGDDIEHAQLTVYDDIAEAQRADEPEIVLAAIDAALEGKPFVEELDI